MQSFCYFKCLSQGPMDFARLLGGEVLGAGKNNLNAIKRFGRFLKKVLPSGFESNILLDI